MASCSSILLDWLGETGAMGGMIARYRARHPATGRSVLGGYAVIANPAKSLQR